MIIQPVKPVESLAPIVLKKKTPVLNFIEPEVLSEYMSILIIGAHGAGKTKLASSVLECEQIEGVLYIDVDRGTKTAARLITQYRNKVKVVGINKLDPIGDMKKIIQWLEIATDREKAEEAGILFVNIVIIDSISFLADRTIAKLWGTAEAVAKGNAPEKAATQPEWDQQKSIVEEWITTLRDMHCHLIVTCHQHSEKNERAGVLMPQLILPGKLGKKLPAFFDEVFWLRIDQSKPDPKKPEEKPKS